MTDVIEQLRNYRSHLDAAIERPTSSTNVRHDGEQAATHGGIVMVDLSEAKRTAAKDPKSGRRLLVAGAVVALLAVAGIVVAGNRGDEAGSDEARGEQPLTEPSATATSLAEPPPTLSAGAVIEAYVAAYNAGDVDALVELFDENAVISNHPLGRRVAGLESIRQMTERDVAEAADTDAYEIERLTVSGDVAMWDHRWINQGGIEWCGSGHEATVAGGRIVTWAFGTTFRCDVPATIEAFVSAYNTGDLDAVMEFFGDDSLVFGHPFASRLEGLGELHRAMAADLAEGAERDAYQISNVAASGAVVTWDLRWTNRRGADFCTAGHSATIEEGRIAAWQWPAANPCTP